MGYHIHHLDQVHNLYYCLLISKMITIDDGYEPFEESYADGEYEDRGLRIRCFYKRQIVQYGNHNVSQSTAIDFEIQ